MALINPLIGSNLVTGAAPFDSTLIGNSIWLDGERTTGQFAEGTWGTESNQDRWIFATWVHLLRVADATSNRSAFFGSGSGGNGVYVRFVNSPDTAIIQVFHRDNAGNEGNIYTNNKFRDLTSWIHVLVDYDSANAVANDRVSLYVNGVRTGYTNGSRPGQNNHLNTNVSGTTFRVGADSSTTADYRTKGYLAQTVFLDNKSIVNGDLATTDFLDTFAFGTNGSQIVPKSNTDIIALASAAGNNSFCLDYSNSSSGTTLVADASSKGNNLTTSTIATANQTVHTPSLQFPVLNALNGDATLVAALESGNRLAVGVGSGSWDSVFATKSMGSSGKYYYEVRMALDTGSNGFIAGIHEESTTSKNWANYIGNSTSSYGLGYALYTATNGFYTNGSPSTISGYTSNITTGDIVMMAVDLDNNKLYWGVNGTFFNSGDPANGTGESTTIQADTEYVFGLSPQNTEQYFVNFGQDSTFGGGTTAGNNTDTNGVGDFKYTVPTGFQCLASTSLTAPDYQGIDYFDTTLYEGNGAGQRVGDFVPYTDLYAVDNSIIFDSGTKNHLQRTMSAAASDSNKKFTLSAWAKRVSITDTYAFALLESTDSGGGNAAGIRLYSQSSAASVYYFQLYAQGSGVTGGNVNVSTVMSAVQLSSWQHFFIQVDTTQSTASDRVKLYIDGVLQEVDNSGGSAAVYPDQDAVFYLGDNDFATQIGKIPYAAAYNSMYIAEHAFLTGTNSTGKTISDFGAVDTATNRWVPKDISGFTFGHNGHYLEFQTTPGSGNGAGTDTSGNGNHFAEAINNSASAWSSYTSYQTIDAPTKNFDNLGGAQVGGTISDGNTKAALGTGGNQIRSNFKLKTGKWYVESDIQATNNSASIGLVPSESSTWSNGPGRDADGGISYETDGDVFSDNVQNATAEASFAAGDVIQMAIDMDAKKVYFGKNNTFGGNPAAGTGGHFLPASILSDGAALITLGNYSSSQASTQQINYGQLLVFDGGSTTNGFKYTPPTGFQAVNQDNLDDTASKLTAWAWIKNRDASDSHMLIDRVRGVEKVVHSDNTTVETTEPNTVQRFLQRGVQIGNDVQVNTVNESYVLWQWLVGEAATTTTIDASSTTPTNSLASTIAAADAGHFSVVGFTGSSGAARTIAHGMGGAPEMMIFMNREQNGANRTIYHKEIGATNYILFTSAAKPSSGNINYFNNTEPGDTVFTVGSGATPDTNGNGQGMIVYCFRSVPGVCKVGTYIGNASTNGSYVHTGFKPAFVMTKTLSSGAWGILDAAREPLNPVIKRLFPSSNGAEDEDGEQLDFLSDGFKLRKAGGFNGSGQTYIYMAMAEIGGNGTLPPIYGR